LFSFCFKFIFLQKKKSTLINALLGKKLLADGVTPTTAKISLIKHVGEAGRDNSSEDAGYVGQDIVVHRFDVPWLRDINLVDTPGTNAVFSQHEILTKQFLPRSDLVLFVTSADRPFSASEREVLKLIQAWHRKLIVAVNKVDTVETEEDKTKVMEFVRTNTQELVGTADQQIPVFAVSARKFLRGEQDLGFEELQKYVLHSLSSGEKAAIKLRSPLGIVSKGF
jgi:GTPase Era involved in 16S rRNA processing